ncbi:MAG TPA: chemotaxis protein CheX [Candidatus Binatia bacterium]|nr:chemotaxis protein CheX [Candidatus Sulfotelmatobacter sp.]HXJ85966.1 chemotaxis protein CheX [Candidatus Binatia bacterium]
MSISKTDTDAANRREYWAPLLELSAQEVFALMLGDKLELAPEPTVLDSLDVTSMVGLAGSLCGLLSVRCSSQCAALMATKMLGADAEGAKGQMEDAVGEVCNMVAGNFKNKISGISESCKLSVPTVITGSNYSLCTLADDYTMEISLLFHGNPVVISLQLN